MTSSLRLLLSHRCGDTFHSIIPARGEQNPSDTSSWRTEDSIHRLLTELDT